MAKIPFSKFNIKKNNEEVKIIQFNNIDIEVKQYLPIQEKLTIIGNTINNAADNNRFPNYPKIRMYMALEILFAYTNITFTDKQKEDLAKLYDMIHSNGLLKEIISAIPEEEYYMLVMEAEKMADSIYKQMNSVYGIMENIAADYSNVGEAAEDIQKKIADPENLTLLKNVMTKLG